MPVKNIVRYTSYAILSIAVATLAVSNARLRSELKRGAATPGPDATAANKAVAAAVKDLVNNAVERANAIPLVAMSARPQGMNDGGDVLVAFSNGGGEVMPPEGEKTPIQASPAVRDLSWHWRGWEGSLVVRGSFRPETIYTLTFAKGWRDARGNAMERPSSVTFKTGRMKPSFTFSFDDRKYWPASRGAVLIPFSSRAATNIAVSVKRAYRSNIPLFGLDRYEQGGVSMELVSTNVPIRLRGEVWELQNGLLDIGSLLPEVRPGIYTVEAYASEGGRRFYNWDGTADFTFALTDLAISFEGSPGRGGRSIATVVSFATGAPVGGAEVTLYSARHQKLCSSRTDANGAAVLEPVLEGGGDRISFVVAAMGDDVSVLELDGETRLAAERGGIEAATGKPRAFVFSERELCRPGEKFESAAFARGPLKDGAGALAGAPVEFRLFDPSGKKVASRKAVADEYGFARTEWTMPVNAALGTWSVKCAVGGNDDAGRLSMRVANYTPDRFKVSIEPDGHEAVGLDQPLEIRGCARYYFDEPLVSGFCSLVAEMVPARLPKHMRGWHVGKAVEMPEKSWKEFVDVGEDGTFRATYPGLASNGLERAFAPVSLVTTASVEEPSGPTVSARSANVFHPTASYIGVREQDGVELAYDVALLPAAAGASVTNVAAKSIEFSLEREVWSRRFVKYGNGQLKAEWHSEMVTLSNCAARVEAPAGDVTGWMGEVKYNPAELPNGRYRLTASDGGALRTSFDFWHWSGEAGERSANPSAITFESGAEAYAPGDEAEVSFVSPFAGNAFVAAGAAGVEDSFRVGVTQGVNRIALRIPASLLASRYYAAVTLVSGDGAEARRLFGVAKVPVDAAGARRLSVSLKMPDVALPLEKCGISVSLADAGGAPRAGIVSIVAVDEGVAALTDYHVGNPFDYFFARDMGNPFSAYDCFNCVFPELRILPDGTFGGDSMPEPQMASRNAADSAIKEKETVRLVLPAVAVGTNGTAEVEAEIPDHSGSLRIFAVAADELRAGMCEETLVVRSPLTIAAKAPRFASGGDEFTLSAVLYRHDGTNGTLNFTAALPDGILADDGGSRIEKSVVLDGTGGAAVAFRLRAGAGAQGPRDIAMELSHGGRAAKAIATVNLRPPRPASTVEKFAVVTNGTQSFRVDSADWLGVARTRLSISASPAAALATSVAWLGDYPHGCLEQTVSCAFPYLAAGELEALGVIDSEKAKVSRDFVWLSCATILQMRRHDGDFGMWPWSCDSWEYGTLLANHFLFEVDRAGLASLGTPLREAQLARLRQYAQVQSPDRRRTAAYATYILAVAGEVDFVNSARNIIASGKVDYPSFLASAAMMRGGFASEGVDMFERTVDARVWESRDPWYGVMDAGLALFVASKTGYGDIARLAPAAARLNSRLRHDGSAWGNTRDNGWATLGLATYAARLGGTKATGSIRIGGGGETQLDVSEKAVVFDIPADCDVSVSADGAMFAQFQTVGVPARPQAGPGRIAVSRRYVDGEGREVKSVRRGELVNAVIEIESPIPIERAVIVDMVPGGFELEDRTFATRSVAGAYLIPDGIPELDGEAELRNDRWIWYGGVPGGTVGGIRHHLTYPMRAVVTGDYAIPALTVEDMYDPDMSGRHEAGDGARIVITD